MIQLYVYILYVQLFHILFNYDFFIGYKIEFPVLYSRSLLFIYFPYNNFYVLISNSYFIPHVPTFSFGSHKFVFYVCESFSFLFYLVW